MDGLVTRVRHVEATPAARGTADEVNLITAQAGDLPGAIPVSDASLGLYD